MGRHLVQDGPCAPVLQSLGLTAGSPPHAPDLCDGRRCWGTYPAAWPSTAGWALGPEQSRRDGGDGNHCVHHVPSGERAWGGHTMLGSGGGVGGTGLEGCMDERMHGWNPPGSWLREEGGLGRGMGRHAGSDSPAIAVPHQGIGQHQPSHHDHGFDHELHDREEPAAWGAGPASNGMRV